MDYFYHLTTMPDLPDEFIQEGLTAKYRLLTIDGSYFAACTFPTTPFYKLLKKEFGAVTHVYLRNPPNSYYDWHVDRSRNCAINWVIKTNNRAMTLYKEPLPQLTEQRGSILVYNIYEVDYVLNKPTLLDTKSLHCVINNFPEDRIILSVGFPDAPYKTVKSFLEELAPTRY